MEHLEDGSTPIQATPTKPTPNNLNPFAPGNKSSNISSISDAGTLSPTSLSYLYQNISDNEANDRMRRCK